MDRPRRPTTTQIRRRRRVAVMVLALLAIVAVYLALSATVFAPVNEYGARVIHLNVHSQAVGRQLGVSVVVPAKSKRRGERPLLVFLHGRGGSDETFTGNEVVFEGLAKLGRRAPIVAFPDGGDHSYWHDRREGKWGRYVMREVIPTVEKRFGTDPHAVAIGGISMGGFGAYDLALLHPHHFCAVGGHSPALWFDGGETAPGAFDSAADFDRNDVVGKVRGNPEAFAGMRVWNDYGDVDPFRVYDEGFVDYLEADGADLSAHSWSGGHDGAYWSRHWPAYLRFYANSLANCD
ncbi:MAG TPA: alpha/beta hydrolase-fold protein [Solirubrobacterales bacterium]|nr:alpha/beta hydrolase-fold protein [Solirubrobacterales bacterium]